jgi:hypothetical protein
LSSRGPFVPDGGKAFNNKGLVRCGQAAPGLGVAAF